MLLLLLLLMLLMLSHCSGDGDILGMSCRSRVLGMSRRSRVLRMSRRGHVLRMGRCRCICGNSGVLSGSGSGNLVSLEIGRGMINGGRKHLPT